MKGQVIHLQVERPGRMLPKAPASAPSLGTLRDLCCGLCKTWTRHRGVRLGDDLPENLQGEITLAVGRAVTGVDEVEISATSRQWLVSFSTTDGDGRYSYSFNIPPRWVSLETSDEE